MKQMRFLTAAAICLMAAPVPISAQRVMENLGRGVVAVRSNSSQVYVGWRLLATDPSTVAFNLYRSADGAPAVKLNGAPLTTTTDFVDLTASSLQSNSYFVRPVINGVEQPASAPFVLPVNTPIQQYLQIPLQIPAGGTADWCPAGTASPYTYNANDGSIGDLDGDGQYEIILKWDPSNSQDNANSGCTGPTILDAYKLDGTRCGGSISARTSAPAPTTRSSWCTTWMAMVRLKWS